MTDCDRLCECQRAGAVGRMLDFCMGVGLQGRRNPTELEIAFHCKRLGVPMPDGTRQWEIDAAENVSPNSGPGTELEEILASLGVSGREGCGCSLLKSEMNVLGVSGCRSRRSDLVQKLRNNARNYSMADVATAAIAAVASGRALQINPIDPLPSLFDMAVNRAEEKR